jgi:hypothetical protein
LRHIASFEKDLSAGLDVLNFTAGFGGSPTSLSHNVTVRDFYHRKSPAPQMVAADFPLR